MGPEEVRSRPQARYPLYVAGLAFWTEAFAGTILGEVGEFMSVSGGMNP